MHIDRIVTVTLNPAIDWVLEVERFRIGAHSKARRIGWYPAGKGVNVSRVLAALGTGSVATGLVGTGELAIFEEYLERVGGGRIVTQLLVVRGRTRDNITIMDSVDDTETHLRDEGLHVQRADVRRVASKVSMLARHGAVVCFCGSIPTGLTIGDVRSMLHRCIDEGARPVVDTSERVLAGLRGERIWLAKLNAGELAVLAEQRTESEGEIVDAARRLCSAQGGPIDWVLATRGADGAILVGPDVELTARVFVHPGLVANTVGCGDSLLAGVLATLARGGTWPDALRRGVGVATANAVSREPGCLSLEDVELYSDAAQVEPLRSGAAARSALE